MCLGVSICVIALICSAVSLGLPYWAVRVNRNTGVIFNYGILQVCEDQLRCAFTALTVTTTTVRKLVSIGTVLLLGSVILGFVQICSSKYRPILFKIGGVLCIFAAIAVISGVITFAVKKEQQQQERNNTIGYNFHAGFYIAIVAGILALLTGILFCIDPVLERCRQGDNGPGDEGLNPCDAVEKWRKRKWAADQVDIADTRIISTQSHSSQHRNHHDQSGGYNISSQTYYYKNHERMKDFAL